MLCNTSLILEVILQLILILFQAHTGSPLYLLYIATQKTVQSGPIDALTGDAKYTLAEEKLLKKFQDDGSKDLKFDAKTLVKFVRFA